MIKIFLELVFTKTFFWLDKGTLGAFYGFLKLKVRNNKNPFTRKTVQNVGNENTH